MSVQSKEELQPGLMLIARGGVLGLIGAVTLAVISFLYQLILARILGPVDLGMINLAVTITDIMVIIIVFGLDTSVIRFIAAFRARGDQEREIGTIYSALSIFFGINLVIVPIFWVSSNWLAETLFQKPDLLPLLKILAINLPIDGLMTLFLAITIANKWMEYRAAIEQTIVPIMKLGLTLGMLFWVSQTAESATIALIISTLIGAASSAIIVWRLYRVKNKLTRPVFVHRELLTVCTSFMLISLINRTFNQTEILILGGLSTSDQVGIYTTGFKTSFLITLFFSSMNIIFAPTISELYADQNITSLSNYLKILTRWSFIIAFPIALVMLILSPEFISFFGNGFKASVPVLQILAIAQLIVVITGPTGAILSMTRYVNINLVLSILNLFLSVVLDVLLIPRFGAFGAAIAAFLTITFINIFRMLQVNWRLKIHPYDFHLVKPVLAGTIAGLVIFVCRSSFLTASSLLRLTLLSGLLCVIYGSLLILFKLNQDDQDFLRNLFRIYFNARRAKK